MRFLLLAVVLLFSAAPIKAEFNVAIVGDVQSMVRPYCGSPADLAQMCLTLCAVKQNAYFFGRPNFARMISTGDQAEAGHVLQDWTNATQGFAFLEDCQLPQTYNVGNHDVDKVNATNWGDPAYIANFEGFESPRYHGLRLWTYQDGVNDGAAFCDHVFNAWVVCSVPWQTPASVFNALRDHVNTSYPHGSGWKLIYVSHEGVDPIVVNGALTLKAGATRLAELARQTDYREGAGGNARPVVMIGGHYRRTQRAMYSLVENDKYFAIFSNFQDFQLPAAPCPDFVGWMTWLSIDDQTGEICAESNNLLTGDSGDHGGALTCATPTP